MRRIRTSMPEPRLDLLPLLDVVFLLLTFFLLALTILVRADVLGLSLPTVTTGERAPDTSAITVAIDAQGAIEVDGEAVEIETLLAHLETILQSAEQRGETMVVFVAADEGGRSGDLLEVLDVLASGGIERVSVLGRPGENPN
ncbi:MAG: ExbD/TolR family protein [Phycisphaerales bacterium JB043]